MAKLPRLVTVGQKRQLSPNMVRVSLTGDALSDFPTGYEGGYVKLVFEREESRPVVRSYTIREYCPDSTLLHLDMVAHGDTGPAATWANRVDRGDTVMISGPGSCQLVNPTADWFLLAGDMSALPAISVNLERLPANAQGDVILEVISEADQTNLNAPSGVNIHWVINPVPEQHNSVLEDTVMALPWREGKVSVWVAGEFSASRQYFRHVRKVERESMYVSCYWKIGETDEGMKEAKRSDPEPW